MSKINGFLLAGLLFSTSAISTGCSDSTPSEHSEPPQLEQTPQNQTTEPVTTAAKEVAKTATAQPEAQPKTKTVQPQPTPPKKAVENQGTQALPAIPTFKDFAAGPPRKQAFFKFMAPLIQKANADILENRQRLQALIKAPSIAKNDQAWLKQQAIDYRVGNFDPTQPADLKALLIKIDAVPAALALAQGANESAWGTSRFARQANNYFGQWCFSKGCGLVPKERNDGATHEVRAFDHPYQSVVSYLNNLNSHPTYKKLREIRAKTRQKGQTPTGLEMAEGLVNYSERKHEYVKELQSMIRYNKLTQYN